MQWLSDIGKLLLMVAGLVAVLDLTKPKIRAWADAVQRRRDETADRWGKFNVARPCQAMVKRIAMQAASQGDGLDSKDLSDITVEEFEDFKQEAWVAIREERRYDKTSLRFPDYIFPFFERRAYPFVIDRLPEPQSLALALAYDEYRRRERRLQRVSVALLSSILPAAVGLGFWFYLGGVPLVIGFFTAYIAVGMGALYISAALLTPRFVTALRWLAVTVWLGLAKAGVKAMGNKKDAQPLRWAAIVAFIIGSLLDLWGGW